MTIFAAATAILFFLAACSPDQGSGVMEVSMTDAPLVQDESIKGVYITVEGIQYHTKDDQWRTFNDFDGPQVFDLLALNSGNSKLLGELVLPSGDYTQIRFMIGGPDEGDSPTNPGTWLERGENGIYDDGIDSPLFIPSGEQTGYKAEADGYFSVPVNGSVAVTADFDLRRAVIKRGINDSYILKPVLRLVVDNQAGGIIGDVDDTTTLDTTSYKYVIYAYEAGSYTNTEADETENQRFPNAVTSSELIVDAEENDYHLAFLAEGAYDLYVARYDINDGSFVDVQLLNDEDLEVTSQEQTRYDLIDQSL
jgi:hypothetical protein